MARQITYDILADSSKFESGMRDAARAAKVNGDKIEDAAKSASRMQSTLDSAGGAADASESKFMGMADVLDGLGSAFGLPTGAATGMMRAFGDLTGGFAAIQPMITGVLTKLGLMTGATTAQAAATGTATAAQRGLNLAFLANPIGLVIAALVALAGAIYVAWNHSETFRRIVTGAFDAVRNVVVGVFTWIKDNWPLLLAILTGPIGIAVHQIVTHWDTIKSAFGAVKDWIRDRISDVVGFFTAMPGRISGVVGGMFDGLKHAFRGALNWVIDAWNGLEFKIPGFKIGPVGYDGFTLGVPDIPRLQRGGPATAGRPYLVGEAGPELFVPGRSGAVIPSGAMGRSYVIHVASLDPSTAAELVVRAVDEYEARNGARYARAGF